MDTYIDYMKTGIDQTYFKINTVGNTVYWPGKGFVKNDTVFVFLEKYNGTRSLTKGTTSLKSCFHHLPHWHYRAA
jgi:hypothetical protein